MGGDDTEQNDKLTLFGLTRQEAAVYRFLCMESTPRTGYEIAKQTGISRSNVYAALNALTEKGASYMMEGAPARYSAVMPRDFCRNYLRRLGEVAAEVERELPSAPVHTDGYITVSGRRRIMDTARGMLEDVRGRVYIAADGAFLTDIRQELETLIRRYVKVVILTPDAQNAPTGAVCYPWEGGRGQVRMIADGVCVLTGDISRDGSPCTCLFSSKEALVSLVKESLKNQIELIMLSANHAAETVSPK